MAEKYKTTNPWNGLRTYVEGELIYGRNEEIHNLALKIIQNNQIIVYGKSGIGKSSILNAGIFPYVRNYGMFPVYIRLEHNVEASYLSQIKDAIIRETERFGNDISIVKLEEKTEDETLWEFFHRVEFRDKEGGLIKPLVVFDQFEEIFTLENNGAKVSEFFNQLADLINNVKPDKLSAKAGTENRSGADRKKEGEASGKKMALDLRRFKIKTDSYKSESDFHVVFTLREDFLSYLERNTTNIPALKNSRFCLQPINDEQAAEIIMMPRPGLVSREVAKLIIEKVTGETDFELDGVPEISVDSAILSLYLSRLYDKMVEEGETTVTAQLVETHSDNIIEDFYSDAIKGLPERSVRWMENTLVNKDGRRDNRDRNTLLRESGLSGEELDRLINEVKLLRQFSYSGDLRVEYIHDVLCPVIVERRREREEKDRIVKIEEKARTERLKNRRRLWVTAASALLIIGIIAGFLIYDFYKNKMEVSEYYSRYELQNGWPVGVGKPLGSDETGKTPLYYKLSKNGHATPHYTQVEAMSSTGVLPSSPRFTLFGLGDVSYTDEKARELSERLSKAGKLVFQEGNNGLIDKVLVQTPNDSTLFQYTYFHVKSEPNQTSWLSFMTPEGQEMPVNANGVDRLMVTYDTIGRMENYMYYDRLRIRNSIDGVYGRSYKYAANDSVTEYLLDEFALPLAGGTYNAVAQFTDEKGNRNQEFRLYSTNMTDYQAGKNEAGASRITENLEERIFYFGPDKKTVTRISRDRFGRVTALETVEGPNDNIPSLVRIAYSPEGNDMVLMEKLGQDRKTPWTSETDTIYKMEYGYADGEKNYEALFTPSRRVYLKKVSRDGNSVVTERQDFNKPYFKEIRKTEGQKNDITYYDAENRPANHEVAFNTGKQMTHKVIETEEKEGKTTEYFRINDAGSLEKVKYKGSLLGADSISSKWEKFDGSGNCIALIYFDEDGNIQKSMRYKYENGIQTERSAMGIDGTPVRSPDWEIEGFGYYNWQVLVNDHNMVISARSVNEFEEPSSYLDRDSYLVYTMGKLDPETIFDVNSNNKAVKEALWGRRLFTDYYMAFVPDSTVSNKAVAYVQILDKKSPLYADGGGLKDGDRIIALDGWNYNPNLSGLEAAWNRLRQAGGSHEFTVLRPEGSGFAKKKITIDNIKDNDLKARYYGLQLTQNEVGRFEKALSNG